MAEDLAPYLAPGRFVDSDHPAVVALAARAVGDATSPRDKAVRLFYAVRDEIRYDPYTISDDPADYRASSVVTAPATFCIPKAVLLAAVARASSIPARLGFADVRNHLTTEKLRRRMGSDLFVYHGYVELLLDGRWLKVTPAFNIELCKRFGVRPLDFDGAADALFHEFDAEGRRHMEYVHHRGTFPDLPFEEVMAAFAEHYGTGVTQGAEDVRDDHVWLG